MNTPQSAEQLAEEKGKTYQTEYELSSVKDRKNCVSAAYANGFMEGFHAKPGLTWVKASEKTPKDDAIKCLRIDGETLRLGHFFVDDGRTDCYVQSNMASEGWVIINSRFSGVEWLSESAPAVEK